MKGRMQGASTLATPRGGCREADGAGTSHAGIDCGGLKGARGDKGGHGRSNDEGGIYEHSANGAARGFWKTACSTADALT